MALLRAREAVMDRFRPMLRAHGVTEQQWRVLRALTETGEVEVTALAAKSCILMPSLSRILRNLEVRGLIERRVPAHDQRRSSITLSATGRQLIDTVAPHSEAHYADITAAVGSRKLDELYELLDDLTGALEPSRLR
jgi:homoprotocatechuate degradation regulator HpaR